MTDYLTVAHCVALSDVDGDSRPVMLVEGIQQLSAVPNVTSDYSRRRI